MYRPPRIALFSDSYHEANGVARTTKALEECARRRNIPFLSVHAGPETRVVRDGSVVRLDLKRSKISSLTLEHDLKFDLTFWRHARRVKETLSWFDPDVVHFTGPNDIGQLGAYFGHRLRIPMVGSWHTNLHEYASRRLQLEWAGASGIRTKQWVEDKALQLLILFYRIPRVVLAPNRELRGLIQRGTGKPVFLMSRGVDTELFTPARRRGANKIVNIGYVGRLSAEKNVRLLHALEAELDAEGLDVRFTIVGDGSERDWLRRNMLRAELTGELRGPALADAYAQMDIVAFPSETDTVGNVVLEAMASGVPPVVMATGGPRFVVGSSIGSGRAAIVANGERGFIDGVRVLVKNRQRREVMAIAARARAIDLLSWDHVFIDVCAAYDAAIAAAKSRSRDFGRPQIFDLLAP